MARAGEEGREVQLPPLDRVFEIDFRLLTNRLAEIPDDVNGVLKLLDGRRTLGEIMEAARQDRVTSASILSKLLHEGIIRPATQDPALAAASWFAPPVEEPALASGPLATPAPDEVDPHPPRIVRFPAKGRGRTEVRILTVEADPDPLAVAPPQADEVRADPRLDDRAGAELPPPSDAPDADSTSEAPPPRRGAPWQGPALPFTPSPLARRPTEPLRAAMGFPPAPRRRALVLVAVGLLLAAVSVGTAWYLSRPPSPPEESANVTSNPAR